MSVMSSMAEPPEPGPGPNRAHRRRADLVAIDGAGGPLGELEVTWYLGVAGTVAHLPATDPAGGSLHPAGTRRPHDEAHCKVFLTPRTADDTVPRCPICLDAAQSGPEGA